MFPGIFPAEIRKLEHPEILHSHQRYLDPSLMQCWLGSVTEDKCQFAGRNIDSDFIYPWNPARRTGQPHYRALVRLGVWSPVLTLPPCLRLDGGEILISLLHVFCRSFGNNCFEGQDFCVMMQKSRTATKQDLNGKFKWGELFRCSSGGR